MALWNDSFKWLFLMITVNDKRRDIQEDQSTKNFFLGAKPKQSENMSRSAKPLFLPLQIFAVYKTKSKFWLLG